MTRSQTPAATSDDGMGYDALPDPATDLGRFVLAVADMAEQTAQAEATLRMGDPYFSGGEASAFERRWTPQQVLAEIALWRGIVERHQRIESYVLSVLDDTPDAEWRDVAIEAPDGTVISDQPPEVTCSHDLRSPWPCADLLAARDACRAYAGAGAA